MFPEISFELEESIVFKVANLHESNIHFYLILLFVFKFACFSTLPVIACYCYSCGWFSYSKLFSMLVCNYFKFSHQLLWGSFCDIPNSKEKTEGILPYLTIIFRSLFIEVLCFVLSKSCSLCLFGISMLYLFILQTLAIYQGHASRPCTMSYWQSCSLLLFYCLSIPTMYRQFRTLKLC